MANSPNSGVCLCIGTSLEGGDLMGADVVTAIKYFSGLGKLWKVHFRNLSAPLPHFVDNGYFDMYSAMRALREVDFDGVAIGDHFPTMVGGPGVDVAYTAAKKTCSRSRGIIASCGYSSSPSFHYRSRSAA